MRTNLTQEHVTAIITAWFEDRDAPVNFMHYGVADDGSFSGCLVDHYFAVELPESGDAADGSEG